MRSNGFKHTLLLITVIAAICGSARANPAGESMTASFRRDVAYLAAVGDRSTAGAGSQTAAAYIKKRLADLGFNDVGAHFFATPVIHTGTNRLSLPQRGLSLSIRPFIGNAVTPPATPAGGITGPLVYVGHGALKDFNNKPIAGAIVVMDLDSGKHWQHAANLGAKALIYIDRGQSNNLHFKDKVELSPVEFPRFWMPASDADTLFGPPADVAQGSLAAEARLDCDARWENSIAENIYCLIPGSRDEFKEELILVEAFYDSRAYVAGLSPGAEEACGAATLLQLAQFFKKHPPQRNILLVATAGHAQSLSGLREMVWALTTATGKLRQTTEQLSALINESRSAINGLSPDNDEPSDAQLLLAGQVLRECIKTEADEAARRLIQLRLAADKGRHQKETRELTLRRQALRRLLWLSSLADADLTPRERALLDEIRPRALVDRKAVLADAEHRRMLLNSAAGFRKKVGAYDLISAVSLHLSSHGDGLGAFNYGWLYPFKPKINRASSYRELDRIMHQIMHQSMQKTAHQSQDQDLDLVNTADMFKDTLRPSRQRSWQSYFLDRPALGGEVTALAGYRGFSLVTTNDARLAWGTPYDTEEYIDYAFAADQAMMICRLVAGLDSAQTLNRDKPPRRGFSIIDGRANFLRQGELFADQPAPGTLVLVYQGPALFHVMVDQMGTFSIHGLADAKHSFHKAILEGYKIDPDTGRIVWTIDKKQTDKDAYRIKMRRRSMETDLVLFAGSGITLFNLLEPRTFRYLTKPKVIDGRREALPVKYFYSRLDTWSSTISTFFLEPGTPLKLTLSDSVLNKKMILLNNSPQNILGTGYLVEKKSVLYPTEYHVARDMWTLLSERIRNIEHHGIYSERIHDLYNEGTRALEQAEQAWQNKQYDRLLAASSKAWALANRVYEDVEKIQKDVLYGVLFYIALFVPFAFCAERLLFSYVNIYKRVCAFLLILILLIAVIYHVHPAFQLAYSPMVVILAFMIMGLSLLVTLIIFFRFEEEINRFHSRAKNAQTDQLGRWKAFAAAFLLGVSNLRRRRLRTALTCTTLVILTFTIMSFTSAKTFRLEARIQYAPQSSYQGILLKNVNWRDLPAEAYDTLADTFPRLAMAVPRVWLEDEDRTRTPRIPIRRANHRFEAQGMLGLSYREPAVSGIDTILTAGRWIGPDDRRAVLLPEHMARNLGIDPADIKGQTVLLWGMVYDVVGIFSAERLQAFTDLDGETMTPATFPREISAEMTEEVVSALESGDDVRSFQSRYQHIESDLTVIVPFPTLLSIGGHLKAVAMRPNDLSTLPTMAQALVDRYGFSLFSGEPQGTFLYHASDSMSYSGVPNIIIPMVISILIVLNTMICSVFERKREIGVYTSVGLAPSHVSFLFVAEAMAFAVLSTVLGYLLAQTAASFLAHTPLWAGITVNYSSMASVGAMVLVILVVLISVIYPSKVAGRIAIPDINRSWTLPPARGNTLTVTLPFLMTYQEHRSIGGFLYDYFEGHRDITHGRFSTANITFEFVCAVPPSGAAAKRVPLESAEIFNECLQLKSNVWLAPFDFGIMQQVNLRFEPSMDLSGFLEIAVELTRQSGEANAWHRINKAFLHGLRKQLLIWRSFDEKSKIYYEQVLAKAETQNGFRRKQHRQQRTIEAT